MPKDHEQTPPSAQTAATTQTVGTAGLTAIAVRKNYSLALVSSLLLFGSAPGQWSLPFLAWFALIPLLIASMNQPARSAAKIGFFCGLLYHLLLMYWIVIVLGRYGGLPLWLAATALLALSAYMGLYYGAFALIISRASRQNRYAMVWLAPVTWVALDLVRGQLFSGLPWQDLGYSQYQYPFLLQFADLAGHFGLTFLILLINSTAAWLLLSCHRPQAPARGKVIMPVAAVIMSVLLYCAWRYDQVETLLLKAPAARIGVIQGNFDQSEKWAADSQAQTVARYLNLSGQALSQQKAELLIWPETALPFFPTGHPLFDKVQAFVARQDTALITGAPHLMAATPANEPQYLNSAFCLSPASDKALPRYDKMHLVPFGEYIPFRQLLPAALPLVHTMGNFTAGKNPAPVACGQLIRAGILICYESIFPDLARHRTAQGANLLVNLTNDAWYGRSSAPWQQLSMVVLRAVENRRSMARAANTGISCLIDPLGRLSASSPLFKEYRQIKSLPLMETRSPFVRFGHIFPYLCLILLSVSLLYGMYRPPRSKDG